MDVTQPESALLALRVLVGVIPAIMLALSILAAWRYPLSREAHHELLTLLERQRLET